MVITLSRRTSICQSVAEVYLTGVTPLGAVSHRFNLLLFYFNLIPRKLVKLIKTYLYGPRSKVRIGDYFSSSLVIENGLRPGDALSPLLLNFAIEYAIRKVQETNLGLDMNDTH